METLEKHEGINVMKLISKEFLDYRLGIESTEKNIMLLTQHLLQFEEDALNAIHLRSMGETNVES